MKTFGFAVNNDTFRNHSWYFRNALVRANYNDLKNGIHATTQYLEMFFSNLLMGTEYELKNRHMHVEYVAGDTEMSQSATSMIPKGKNCTLECTLEEMAILRILMAKPDVTQTELADRLGKSVRTVKSRLALLQTKQYIRRVNGKRYGKWEVLVTLDFS